MQAEGDTTDAPDLMHILVGSAFLSVALVAILSAQLGATTHPTGNFVAGLAACAYGAGAFVIHGGPRITTLGLFNFSCALFVGFSGAHEAINPTWASTPQEYLGVAIVSCFAAQVAVTLTSHRGRPEGSPPCPRGDAQTVQVVVVGLAVLAALLAGQRFGVGAASGVVGDGFAFASVALVAGGLIFHPHSQLLSKHTVLAAAVFVAYATAFHGGTGRLRLVALACAIGLLLTARFPRRGLKALAVLATPLVAWWLARDRLTMQERFVPGASDGRNGLESMLSAIATLARVLEAQAEGRMEPRWGETFLSLPFAGVPESWAPGWAPAALGYDLVHLVSPARVDSGYSVVATGFGEWIWNFTIVGLLLAIPAMVIAVRTLDRRFEGAVGRVSTSSATVVSVCLWAVLAGSIADLVWSGWHTYLVRNGTRLPLLLVAFWWFTTTRHPKDSVDRDAAGEHPTKAWR